ncbi:MAG: hypothetical protein ACK4OF_02895 [Aquificaceae bacterium]
MWDLYRVLKQEAIKVIKEERKRRREAFKLRLELNKKLFDRKKRMH